MKPEFKRFLFIQLLFLFIIALTLTPMISSSGNLRLKSIFDDGKIDVTRLLILLVIAYISAYLISIKYKVNFTVKRIPIRLALFLKRFFGRIIDIVVVITSLIFVVILPLTILSESIAYAQVIFAGISFSFLICILYFSILFKNGNSVGHQIFGIRFHSEKKSINFRIAVREFIYFLPLYLFLLFLVFKDSQFGTNHPINHPEFPLIFVAISFLVYVISSMSALFNKENQSILDKISGVKVISNKVTKTSIKEEV